MKGDRVIRDPGEIHVQTTVWYLCVSADKMEDKDGKGAFMYYVNDGVYGSFNCLLYDHAEVEARLVNVSCSHTACFGHVYCNIFGGYFVLKRRCTRNNLFHAKFQRIFLVNIIL